MSVFVKVFKGRGVFFAATVIRGDLDQGDLQVSGGWDGQRAHTGFAKDSHTAGPRATEVRSLVGGREKQRQTE